MYIAIVFIYKTLIQSSCLKWSIIVEWTDFQREGMAEKVWEPLIYSNNDLLDSNVGL